MGLFRKKDKEEVQVKKVESPYLNGREEWLERYGSYIKQRDGWRFFAILMTFTTCVCIYLTGYMATQNKIIPYIVEVDKLGRASAIAPVDETKRVSLNNVIPSVISMIISDWRTVTADIELQKRMIKRLSFFTAGAAKGYFADWYQKFNPYERGKENLITVELKSLPLAVSENSYRIEWTEITRNHTGVMIDSTQYEATVTIKFANPSNEEMILYNPTGIFITNVDATKLF